MYCTYRVYLDEKDTKTKTVSETSNPTFGHTKKFSFSPVTDQVSSFSDLVFSSLDHIHLFLWISSPLSDLLSLYSMVVTFILY